MNYFDPARPKVGDRPALLWKNQPIGALPALCITPTFEGAWIAEVCVVIAPSTGRWLQTAELMLEDIQGLIFRYKEQPERTLLEEFNWVYNAEARRESRSLSLTDLGDLE